MDADQALDFTNNLLRQKGYKNLNSIEGTIFREAWNNPDKKYKLIARETNYADGAINTIAYNTWKRLTKLFEVSVTKNRLREIVESYIRNQSTETARKANSTLVVTFSNLEDSSFAFLSNSESIFFDFTNNEKRIKYQQALDLVKAAGSLESWDDLRLILKAFNIYKQLGDVDQAANLFVKPVDTLLQRQEPVGTIAYRLGYFTETSFAVNWLIEKAEAGCYLPTYVISRLYNMGGDLIWMSSNDTLQSIQFHQKSQEYAYKSQNERLIVASEFNQALCNIDREEVEEARNNIAQGYELNYSIGKDYDHSPIHKICFDCVSAYVETLINKSQASELATIAYFAILDDNKFEQFNGWEKNNLPVYAARALQNIGSYERAFEMYMKADSFAKASGCIQVEAQALIGKALLCYLEDKRFSSEKSIAWLLKAKKMLDLINAEGDQAYVNLLLGVMFKDLGKPRRSQQYFKEAESFYTERRVPQKIIRLNQIREDNSLI